MKKILFFAACCIAMSCSSNQGKGSVETSETCDSVAVVLDDEPAVSDEKETDLVGTWCADGGSLKIMQVLESDGTFIMNCIGKNNETQDFRGTWTKKVVDGEVTVVLTDEGGTEFSFSEKEFLSGEKWKKIK